MVIPDEGHRTELFVKNLFRHRKTRYKGLVKNTTQLFSLFGFANLVLARRWLFDPGSQVAP